MMSVPVSPPVQLSSEQLQAVPVALEDELDLELCLNSGQTFSWTRIGGLWVNIVNDLALILSKGDDGHVCAMLSPTLTGSERATTLQAVQDYFYLKVSLAELSADWARRDPHYRAAATRCPGVRLLRQPAFESMVAFICSQNNGIARITSMVRTLKEKFGRLVASLDGTPLYAFPEPAALAGEAVEGELRRLGFGYRAGYIPAVARSILDGHLDLRRLAAPTDGPGSYDPENYRRAWSALREVKGIGPKVADCIALTGLGHADAVPIDTHIWRVARTKYPGMPTGLTLTLNAYTAIGDHFRKLFGPQAGWAHLVRAACLHLRACALISSRSHRSSLPPRSASQDASDNSDHNRLLCVASLSRHCARRASIALPTAAPLVGSISRCFIMVGPGSGSCLAVPGLASPTTAGQVSIMVRSDSYGSARL